MVLVFPMITALIYDPNSNHVRALKGLISGLEVQL